VGSEVSIIPRTRNVYYAAYASLPTSGVRTGDLGYATDRKVFYRWSGSAWEPVSIHSSSGAAADIPTAANLPDGSLYYETDTALLKQVQSSSWATISPTPTFASLSDTKVVRKTADETVNNSNAIQDDDELVLPVGANEIWYIFMLLRITTVAAAAFDYLFTIPAGGSLKGADSSKIGAAVTAAEEYIVPFDATGPEQRLASAADKTDVWELIYLVYIGGGAAGNIQLQWAQGFADVSDTKVLANSFIIAHKLN